jgi:hypothetical protein
MAQPWVAQDQVDGLVGAIIASWSGSWWRHAAMPARSINLRTAGVARGQEGNEHVSFSNFIRFSS